MKTRFDLNQIKGHDAETLQQNMEYIQHIKGQVETEEDLNLLNAKVDDQVFVRSLNKLKRFTGDEWIDVTIKVEDEELIKHVTSLTRPSFPRTGQHIFETDTMKTYRNIGSPSMPIWEEVGAGAGGGGVGGGFESQVTKLNVVATPTEPYEVLLEIPLTTDFKRVSPEVLKFTPGQEGVIQTLVTFDNGDETDFEENEFIEFDGTMKLKTTYSYSLEEDPTWAGDGKLYSARINKTKFKAINKIEVH